MFKRFTPRIGPEYASDNTWNGNITKENKRFSSTYEERSPPETKRNPTSICKTGCSYTPIYSNWFNQYK